jgi:DNA polymerase III epsilon subunit-like protein
MVTVEDERPLSELALALGVDHGHLREVDPARELPFTELTFVAIDTETTGLDPGSDRILEVAAVRYDAGIEVTRVSSLCRFEQPLPEAVREITGIADEDVRGAPDPAEVLARLEPLLAEADFVVAYNAPFDRAFLEAAAERAGRPLPRLPWVDVLVLIRELDRYKPGKNLGEAARRWGVSPEGAHRALPDARATAKLLLKVAPFLPARSLTEVLEHQSRWSERQSG